jgi:hypothetical protein
MTENHPITPPPELVEPSRTQLCQLFDGISRSPSRQSGLDYLQRWIVDWTTDKVNRAAQWGADQELEACCLWLEKNVGRWEIPLELRDARRPKPPSLKERAIAVLDDAELDAAHYNILLRALEQLND